MPQIQRKEDEEDSLKRNGLKIRIGALFCSVFEGSLTLESALVLPCFLFAMVTVLFLFRVLQLQYMTGEALDKAVTEAALFGKESPEEVENQVKLLFYKELAAENSPISMVNLEMAGFSWEGSAVDETYIDMKLSYQVKLPGWVLKNRRFSVAVSGRSRRWSGMSGKGEISGPGEWVYITPEGSVYHKSRNCSYLKLSIQRVTSGEVQRYRACELCAEGESMPSFVYITEEGNCYHIRLNCSGLKRTVYMIPLSQAEGRGPCSRCGGE